MLDLSYILLPLVPLPLVVPLLPQQELLLVLLHAHWYHYYYHCHMFPNSQVLDGRTQKVSQFMGGWYDPAGFPIIPGWLDSGADTAMIGASC